MSQIHADKVKSQSEESNHYRFEGWRFDGNLNSLFQGKKRYKLPQKQSQLLSLLIRRDGQIVTRDEILEHIWGFKPVTDDVLSRNISALRKTLGDDRGNPMFIETIPKKGYRFVASAVVCDDEGRVAQQSQSRLPMYSLISLLLIGLVLLIIWPDPGPEQRLEFDVARPLTGLSTSEQHPWFSGDRVIYVVHGNDSNREIWAHDMLDHTQTLIHQSRDTLLSPIVTEEEQLVYLSTADDACHLMQLMSESGTAQSLGDCWASHRARVRADEEGRLLVNMPANDTVGTVLRERNGRLLPLTAPESNGHFDMAATRMIDSDKLLLIRGDQIVNELFHFDPTDQTLTQLTFDNQYLDGFCQLDPQTVIYASDRNGIQSLWQLDLDNLSVFSLGQIGARRPTCHPQHGLVYELTTYEANIWTVPINAESKASRLIQSDRYDNHPTPSPDGTTLAYISNRTGDQALWSSGKNGESPKMQYQVINGRVTRPRWSPDGNTLVVTVYEEHGSTVRLLDSEFNELKIYPHDDAHVLNPVLSDDGWLYFLRDDSDGRILQRVSLESWGEPETILRSSISRFDLLTDGRILFVSNEQDGFQLYDPVTENSRTLLPEFSRDDWAHWTLAIPDGADQPILYHSCDQHVCATAVDDGQQTRLDINAANAIGLTMAYDARKDALLMVYTDRVSSQLMHMGLKNRPD